MNHQHTIDSPFPVGLRLSEPLEPEAERKSHCDRRIRDCKSHAGRRKRPLQGALACLLLACLASQRVLAQAEVGPTTAGPATTLRTTGEDDATSPSLSLSPLPIADQTQQPPATTPITELTTETTTPSTTTTTTTTTTTSMPIVSSEKPKIQPVNFTEVDQLFRLALNESEVVSKWKALDKKLVEGVRSILKIIFPHVVAMSSDAKVSGPCSGAILKWILNLRNLRTWAVKLLDASGKPSSGILEGGLWMAGNYRQCLGVRAPDEDEIEISDGQFQEYFRGQYCVLQMKPQLPAKQPFFSLNSTLPSLMRQNYKYYEKNVYDDLAELALAFNFVHIRADLCVPSLCSRDDIQRVANFLASKVDMRARVARCDVEPFPGTVPLMDRQQMMWALGLGAFLVLVALSSMAHWSLRMGSNPDLTSKEHRVGQLLTSMSLQNSINRFRSVHLERLNERKPVFLHAIKLILLLWIFLVSLVGQLEFQFMREMLPLRDMIMELPMQLIVNSSLAFDSLILIAAFIYAYENINSNLSDLLRYNLAKYFPVDAQYHADGRSHPANSPLLQEQIAHLARPGRWAGRELQIQWPIQLPVPTKFPTLSANLSTSKLDLLCGATALHPHHAHRVPAQSSI